MFAGQIFFAIVFLLFSILANWEFIHLGKNKNLFPEKVSTLVLGIVFYCICLLSQLKYLDSKILFLTFPFFFAIPIVEIFRKKHSGIMNVTYAIFGVFYVVSPLILLNYIYKLEIDNTGNNYTPLLLGFFIILWLNDTGAYLSGITFGKHKLFEKISPNKTWEGLLGGAIVSLVTAYLYARYFTQIEEIHFIHIALIIIVFGTVGDLFESLIKRNFNVKDSGKTMPGHGGMLDRIDSILFAAPMVFIYVNFFV